VAAGGVIEYGSRATGVVVNEAGRAAGVRTADGRTLRARAVISNATRWDTFDRLVPSSATPPEEAAFRAKYKKAPSFLSMHLGIQADCLPPGTECHHILCEDWEKMEEGRGTLFVSIPSLLDPGLCPPGTHVFHAFTPDWVDAWPAKDADPAAYAAAKEAAADAFVARLERVFPGLAAATLFREVGTPRTHRRFLGRVDGTYGPIPAKRLAGMLAMPMARTGLPGLYCAGDSTFPGQGVNAVVFSGVGCAHRVLADQGRVPTLPGVDGAFNALLRAARAWA
jgi:prolycopene isomerase